MENWLLILIVIVAWDLIRMFLQAVVNKWYFKWWLNKNGK